MRYNEDKCDHKEQNSRLALWYFLTENEKEGGQGFPPGTILSYFNWVLLRQTAASYGSRCSHSLKIYEAKNSLHILLKIIKKEQTKMFYLAHSWSGENHGG